MATVTENAPKVWTPEDLLAMPDDGVERWIIKGQLREKPSEYPGATMTVRNRYHSAVLISVGAVLKNWLKTQPEPRGQVYGGEVGVILPGHTTAVGVDVMYADADVVAVQNDDESTLIEGVPVLTVEILSPNDTHEQIEEKIDTYLGAGVPLVWTVNVYRRTVTVFRTGHEPESFNLTHRMPTFPQMPGFTTTVAELFE
jgi:Uma2 family endonuclease